MSTHGTWRVPLGCLAPPAGLLPRSELAQLLPALSSANSSPPPSSISSSPAHFSNPYAPAPPLRGQAAGSQRAARSPRPLVLPAPACEPPPAEGGGGRAACFGRRLVTEAWVRAALRRQEPPRLACRTAGPASQSSAPPRSAPGDRCCLQREV